MNSYDYYGFSLNFDPEVVSIVNIRERVENHSKLREGTRMGELFPANTVLDIFEDAGDIMTDFIDNISRVPIISSRVKEIFESYGLDDENVEYLPVTIKDKRGEVIDADYYVANALMKIKCLDAEMTDPDTDSDPTVVEEPELSNLRKDLIPEEAKFFRLSEMPQVIVIRSDLLDSLRKENITGLSLKRLP